MGYCHTELSPGAKNLCNSVLPWGNHEYKKLSTGVYNSPAFFQEHISELFEGFDMVCAYIDDVLAITKNILRTI